MDWIYLILVMTAYYLGQWIGRRNEREDIAMKKQKKHTVLLKRMSDVYKSKTAAMKIALKQEEIECNYFADRTENI